VAPENVTEKKDKRLVIVESPAKARTIKGYSRRRLRRRVERWSHSRPAGAGADIPEQYKKEKWARLGVDVDTTSSPCTSSIPTRRRRSAS
jgi:DNA topoisomerase-1